jgi:MFS family permease
VTEPKAPRFDPRRRRAVTVALVLVTALASFESTVVSTAMPTIIGDLGGLPLYSWVFSIYLLTATVMMPIYGRLADIYGRRRVLLIAIAVFLAGAITCGFARSMPQLILARGLQGLGAAGLIPIALTVSGDLFSLKERAKVQGLFSGVWGVASLAGPLIGAWMTMSFGWRSIFTINIPLGLIALTLVWTQMVESRATLPDPLDLAGAASLAVGVTALLFAVLHRPGAGANSLSPRVGLFLLAFGSLTLFVRLQKRRRHPLIPPELFRHMRTAAPYLGGILMGTTIYGVDTFVPLFVQGARGGTAGAAGAVVTPLVFLWAISAAIAARLVVRFGFRRTARWGAILILAGLAALSAAAWLNASVPWISAACALVGAGLGPSSISQVLGIQNVVSELRRARGGCWLPGSPHPEPLRSIRRSSAWRSNDRCFQSSGSSWLWPSSTCS